MNIKKVKNLLLLLIIGTSLLLTACHPAAQKDAAWQNQHGKVIALDDAFYYVGQNGGTADIIRFDPQTRSEQTVLHADGGVAGLYVVDEQTLGILAAHAPDDDSFDPTVMTLNTKTGATEKLTVDLPREEPALRYRNVRLHRAPEAVYAVADAVRDGENHAVAVVFGKQSDGSFSTLANSTHGLYQFCGSSLLYAGSESSDICLLQPNGKTLRYSGYQIIDNVMQCFCGGYFVSCETNDGKSVYAVYDVQGEKCIYRDTDPVENLGGGIAGGVWTDGRRMIRSTAAGIESVDMTTKTAEQLSADGQASFACLGDTVAILENDGLKLIP